MAFGTSQTAIIVTGRNPANQSETGTISGGGAYADVDGDGAIGQHEIVGKLNGANFYSLLVEADGDYTFKLLDTLKGTNIGLDAKDIKAGAPNTNSIEVGALQSDDFVRITGGAAPSIRATASSAWRTAISIRTSR